MSSSSGEYKIKIKTENEGHGAAQAADELKDVGKKLESAAGGYRNLISQGKGRQGGLDTDAAVTKVAADEAAGKESKNAEEYTAASREAQKLQGEVARLKAENQQLLSLHNKAAEAIAHGEEIGESHAAVAAANQTINNVLSGKAGAGAQSEVHTVLQRLTDVVNAHVTMTTEDRRELEQAKRNISNLESSLRANIGY